MTGNNKQLNSDNLSYVENEKHYTIEMSDGIGKIVGYQPLKNMQVLYYDIHSDDIPNLWRKHIRKSGKGQYLRTLICKRGRCEFVVNGVHGKLMAGEVMMDFGIDDRRLFKLSSDSFIGVEITMQVDKLVEENTMMKMLKSVIKSMKLPEKDIFDSDGYIFSYSKNTKGTLDKLLESGFGNKAGIVVLAHVIEIGHNLGEDLKNRKACLADNPRIIAEDIYKCLTERFYEKYTASFFAEKYGLSDTMVKKYFKQLYGYGFKEYQNKVRMEWASIKLTTTDMKVKEIAESVGYIRSSKFIKAFKDYYGQTPLVYRQNHYNDPAEA